MGCEKTVVVAGQTIFVKVSLRKNNKPWGEKRVAKAKATPEQIERINQKNSERVLAIIINHNFGRGDYHLVLTYSGEEPSKDFAKKKLDKFKRDLLKLYRKKGSVLKWITATEYENARIHHHMICSGGVDLKDIIDIWPHGFIRPTHLDKTGDYRRLASYLIKETSKTFRKPGSVSRRRYNCSRSIVRPEARVDRNVSATHLIDPKPVDGYYIDQDSIYRGENPVTGKPYLEYVMISLTEEPRIKAWNRGHKKKLRAEYFKVGKSEQVEMILEDLIDGREVC